MFLVEAKRKKYFTEGRFEFTDTHSYVVAVCGEKLKALELGEQELIDRAGKYHILITPIVNCLPDYEKTKYIYYDVPTDTFELRSQEKK